MYKWNYAGLAKPTKMIDLFGGKIPTDRPTVSYGVMTQAYFKQYLNYWLARREFQTTKLIEKCDILVVKFRLTDVWIMCYLSSDSYCQKYNYFYILSKNMWYHLYSFLLLVFKDAIN